jgi:RHS repeat-associated protein
LNCSFLVGYERDNESGLDYAQARYYSNVQGRFTSPDAPFVGQYESDPQTWNLYAYTSNNPLNRVDPDGQRWFYKQNGNEITDIQWVNPNDDGSYTSPGNGYTAFVPTAANPTLMVFINGGNQAVFFGENKDGSPYQSRAIATGRVEDASWELVGLFINVRSVGSLSRAAWTSWTGYLERRAANAFAREVLEAARAGGRHSGFLRNYLNKTAEEIKRGIRSIEKQIAEHESKIADPAKHIDDWVNLDPRQQAALVTKKWPGDIQRQKEQLVILKELLKSK